MQCQCMKKDNTQCSYKAKFGKFCGVHKDCKYVVGGKKPVSPKKYKKNAPNSPLKTVKRFPLSAVKLFLESYKNKIDLKITTTKDLRVKAEIYTGIDLSSVEFKKRFRQLTIEYLKKNFTINE